ncbi:DUF6302 family protein [Streptomyces sp. NPDC054835]|uniref:DUF6302 family protein n=1 Tax=Streptomyces exfoliatus TaxID=1905 RepID=UPI0012FEB385|nr:DUF6302 family protein [Streptomyces exfoliatus]
MRYRVSRIALCFGLSAAVRPQLVDFAYTHGVLPAPELIQPLVLEAKDYHLVRMLAAGRTVGEYARRWGIKRFQADYIMQRTSTRLDATTRSSLIRRAWQRQVLGPSLFAADLARMHAQQSSTPEAGRYVIVPLISGYRLAGPAGGLRRTRYLDIPDEAGAQAAARFLSGRDGFAPLWITGPERPGGPHRVSWGRKGPVPQPGHLLASGQPRRPTGSRYRTA